MISAWKIHPRIWKLPIVALFFGTIVAAASINLTYGIAPDSIAVEFKDGAIYLYTEESASRSDIERIKDLAVAGRGLSTFIVSHVRQDYAARLR